MCVRVPMCTICELHELLCLGQEEALPACRHLANFCTTMFASLALSPRPVQPLIL